MRCPFCRADVPNLGDHYGGFNCEPCPDVRMAFDPNWWPIAKRGEEMPEEDKAERRRARVQRWRDAGRRRQALALEGIS